MKIAITTSGDSLESSLDPRFGRAAKFLIYDMTSGDFEIVDNTQNLNAAQGAGIQAAQNVAQSGVECVITGHCGPKAFRVLSAAGIKIYNCTANTVAEALDQLSQGHITPANSADVKGHWM